MEAICQRALALLKIPAVTTRARVFAGVQAVLPWNWKAARDQTPPAVRRAPRHGVGSPVRRSP